MSEFNPLVSLFAPIASGGPRIPVTNPPLRSLLADIRGGKYHVPVEAVRAEANGSEEQDTAKKRLPGFTAAGAFALGQPIKGKAPEHEPVTGQVDFDGKDNRAAFHSTDSVRQWRDKLADDPHVFAAFVSPTGTGVKVIMRLAFSGVPFAQKMEAARAYLSEKYALVADKIDDVQRLCFVSDDPDLRINEAAVPHVASVVSPDEGDAEGDITHITSTLDDITLEEAARVVACLDPDMAHRDWIRVAAGLKHQFPNDDEAAFVLFDEWSAKAVGAGKYGGSEKTRGVWKSFKAQPLDRAPTTFASLLKLAKERGYKPQKRSAAPDGVVVLPSGSVEYPECAEALAGRLGESNIYSFFGKSVVEAVRGENGATLVPLKAEGAATRFQQHVSFMVWRAPDGKQVLSPAPRPPVTDMKELLAGGVLAARLRNVELVSNCPILVENPDGSLDELGPGYHARHKVLIDADAKPAARVDVCEAAASLLRVVEEYNFPSSGDHLRMLADYITPALVMGDLLGAQAPICITEADQSQSGKGYHQKCVRAFYRAKTSHVTQRDGGVGGFDETLSASLVKGHGFTSIDNFRGKLNSQMLESLLTAEKDTVDVRVPYREPVPVSARRRVVQLTSNGLEATEDLANRANFVRIRKRVGHTYRKYPEGDLETHIVANQPYYLGCVFALVRAWHAAGRPTTNEKRHDRRIWAQSVDGLLEHVYCGVFGSLMDDIEQTKQRVSNPSLSWLRNVVLAVARDDLNLAREWSSTALVDLCRGCEPAIVIPGERESAEKDDGPRAVGALLGKLFQGVAGSSIEIEGISVSRVTVEEYSLERHETRKVNSYRFARIDTVVDEDLPLESSI